MSQKSQMVVPNLKHHYYGRFVFLVWPPSPLGEGENGEAYLNRAAKIRLLAKMKNRPV